MGPLLFIIYINDIHRSSNLGKFILFDDDTNIFVADKCKNTVYETANKVLEFVYRLYTRYPIVARRAQPLGRVRRASKGILHTSIQVYEV